MATVVRKDLLGEQVVENLVVQHSHCLGKLTSLQHIDSDGAVHEFCSHQPGEVAVVAIARRRAS